MTEQKTEMLLKSIGLTEYEAKAYMTLIKYGVLTAEKVSRLGGIPLPRVYDTIMELRKKGLVLVGKSRPKKFKPIEAKRAIGNFIEYQESLKNNQLQEIRDKAKGIIEEIASTETSVVIAEDTMEIWSIERKSAINKMFDDIKSSAKKEILIFSGDLSWLDDAKNVIKSLTKRGIRCRILVKGPGKNQQIIKNIKEAQKCGADVKVGYEGDLRAHIVDDKTAAIVRKNPISGKGAETGVPGNESSYKYELLVIDNPVLVRPLKENFEFWWNKVKQQ